VYPNVDVAFYSRERDLEYDFILAPGADVSAIQLRISGAQRTSVDGHGGLVLETASGQAIQHSPAMYQMRHGRRTAVEGRYRVLSGNRVGFEAGRYDPRLPLVIDPVLSYATFLGGAASDTPAAIAVDAAGNAYIAGGTQSLNFPVTAGAYQGSLKGGSGDTDAFVTKLSADGRSVLFSTYLGGSSYDSANAIALDSSGIYVAGATRSPNFPVTAGAVQTTSRGPSNAFIAKLNPGGTGLIYSTYLGGSGADSATALAIDTSGNAFIAGSATSPNFPTSPSAYQSALKGFTNAFVAKLNPNATALIYSTYLGGSGADTAAAIALRTSGGLTYAYITGQTGSLDFPATSGVVQAAYNNAADAFVTQVKADGTGLVYSTYLGGCRADAGTAIAVDSNGYAYVAGWTDSPDFPVTPGSYQIALAAPPDAFVAKLNSTGSAFFYSTYLGAGGSDMATGIALDNSISPPNVIVAGVTSSSNFPVLADAFQSNLVQGQCCASNAYLTKLNSSGANLLYSTYLGGVINPTGATGMAVDAGGNV